MSIQAVSALEQFGQVKFTRAPCAETSSVVSAAPDFTIRPGLLSSTASPAFRNSTLIFLRSWFFGFWHLNAGVCSVNKTMPRKVLARKGQEERAEIKLVVQPPDKAFETGLPGL